MPGLPNRIRVVARVTHIKQLDDVDARVDDTWRRRPCTVAKRPFEAALGVPKN
jgi:hypothetical protein